jgi:hypothetical protein
MTLTCPHCAGPQPCCAADCIWRQAQIEDARRAKFWGRVFDGVLWCFAAVAVGCLVAAVVLGRS